MELIREDASAVIPPRYRFFTLAFDEFLPLGNRMWPSGIPNS